MLGSRFDALINWVSSRSLISMVSWILATFFSRMRFYITYNKIILRNSTKSKRIIDIKMRTYGKKIQKMGQKYNNKYIIKSYKINENHTKININNLNKNTLNKITDHLKSRLLMYLINAIIEFPIQ